MLISHLRQCLETTNVPMVKYNFVPLSGLEELNKDSTCGAWLGSLSSILRLMASLDVIGIVKETGSLGEITSKTTNKTVRTYHVFT